MTWDPWTSRKGWDSWLGHPITEITFRKLTPLPDMDPSPEWFGAKARIILFEGKSCTLLSASIGDLGQLRILEFNLPSKVRSVSRREDNDDKECSMSVGVEVRSSMLIISERSPRTRSPTLLEQSESLLSLMMALISSDLDLFWRTFKSRNRWGPFLKEEGKFRDSFLSLDLVIFLKMCQSFSLFFSWCRYQI